MNQSDLITLADAMRAKGDSPTVIALEFARRGVSRANSANALTWVFGLDASGDACTYLEDRRMWPDQADRVGAERLRELTGGAS
jgi:hypothetical protein